MTPGDETEQLPQVTGPSAGTPAEAAPDPTVSAAKAPASATPPVSSTPPASSVPKFPLRPEDVDKARAEAKAAKEAKAASEAKAAAGAKATKDAGVVRPASNPSVSGSAPGGGTSGAATGARASGAGAAAGAGAGAAASAVAARSGARPTATSAPRPAAKKAAAPAGTGRRVRLTLSRIDPWSALKMSFLLSVALGIAMVVATAALWLILAGMGAFDQVNNLVGQIIQDGEKKFDIMDFVGFGRVVSLSIVFAVIDVFLITAIATLGAFIYNVSSSLVGGLHLTLTDD